MLDTKGSDCKGWNKTDLDAVLAWYNPPKRTQLSTREEKEQAWIKIQTKDGKPPICERWTDDDEQELLEASKVDIAVGDTALGRMQKRKSKEAQQSIITMADDELTEALAAREMANNISLDTTQDGAEGTV